MPTPRVQLSRLVATLQKKDSMQIEKYKSGLQRDFVAFEILNTLSG